MSAESNEKTNKQIISTILETNLKLLLILKLAKKQSVLDVNMETPTTLTTTAGNKNMKFLQNLQCLAQLNVS